MYIVHTEYRGLLSTVIKPYGLGSRIRDMEAEWRLRVITDLLFLGESLVSRTGAEG